VPVARNRSLAGVTAILSVQPRTPVVGQRFERAFRAPQCFRSAPATAGRWGNGLPQSRDGEIRGTYSWCWVCWMSLNRKWNLHYGQFNVRREIRDTDEFQG